MAFQPGATLGPYKILSLIGAGGMGEVYRSHGIEFYLSKVVTREQ